MAPIRHSDTDLGWVNRRFAELQKQINALRSEKRLQSSSISEGGITVRDGGSIHVQDGGDILVWYPQDSYSGAAIVAGDVYSSDTGDYSGTGLLVQKTTSGGGNGDDVLTAIANPGTGDAQVIIRSDGDAAVWADNDGLQRPYLATPLYPERYTDWPGTSSGTFETLWRGVVTKGNPRLLAEIRHTTDEAATTGQVRVVLDGSPVGTDSVGFVITSFVADAAVPGTQGTAMWVEVQARRTAGTGTVRVGPSQIRGHQS